MLRFPFGDSKMLPKKRKQCKKPKVKEITYSGHYLVQLDASFFHLERIK